MTFKPFTLEQFLSENEQFVDYNYSESGVHPVKLAELLEMAGLGFGDLADVPINYPEVNGAEALREKIAALYPDATAENVLVTVGASEANLLAATTLLAPGDDVLALRPTYLQFGGMAANIGVHVHHLALDEAEGWRLDVGELEDRVSDNTRVISIVNPNNPTGSMLTASEIEALIRVADRVGAWILADEVYAGTEHDGAPETETLYGKYDRVIAVNSMSKAYGLPGLRVGWMVGPSDTIEALWRRHEYAVVSTTMLSNILASAALDVRSALINRTRALIQTGFATLNRYLRVHPGVFEMAPPRASALSFVRYNLPVNSTRFAARLRQEKSVLMVPGDCFGMDHHLRISSALPLPYLEAGLSRFNELVASYLDAP
ncbi:MAG: aminotransferase class I/II-fold pyridoxal phosphate-dependent enzyme [Bacteroidota bacterium]